MESLKELYKIGRGPSSSHTMAPYKASCEFKNKHPEADSFKCELYGSLSLTGKGHMTDVVIVEAFEPFPTEVVFKDYFPEGEHPNTMELIALRKGMEVARERVYSIGGGSFRIKGEDVEAPQNVYELESFKSIREYCRRNNMRIWQYVEECEGKEIWDYLFTVWNTMKESIERGISTTGVLQGGLGTPRKANYLYNKRHIDESERTRENRMVCAYAFAVCEENASGGKIVTAPTCGASGVVPATLKYMQDKKGFTDEEVIHALATGGIIGNLIKTNASISGAACGCQAEVGSACSMSAAALAELFYLGLNQIEYAAEVSMEHHLGLTCDPVAGLVQIPCIERNAVAAMRSINSLNLSNFLAELQQVSFDTVVKTMYETGMHLNPAYRETSQGGLAKFYGYGE